MDRALGFRVLVGCRVCGSGLRGKVLGFRAGLS